MVRKRYLMAAGFTLTEILLVVIIIGILVGMVIPNIAGRGKQARIAAAKADIEANLAMALDMYELDNGRYPTSEQGLRALLTKPNSSPVPENWSGPYLKKRVIPKDPWGHAYIYQSPGEHNPESYDLYSSGPDEQDNGDDIRNWQTGEEASF